MDIPREKKPDRRKYFAAAAGLAAVVVVTLALSRLDRAAPSVARSTLWIDTVRKGTMVREVRAPGTLVPEEIRWVSALTAGRVEARPVQPPQKVGRNDVILVLSNPDVQLEALEAERQYTAAQAGLVNLRVQLETERLNQRAAAAKAAADHADAQRAVQVAQALDAKGLSSANELQRAKDVERETGVEEASQTARLKLLDDAVSQQIALEQAQVERMRRIAEFNEGRVASMHVVAGEDGVLQELPLELGQWVTPGQLLAKVAQPGHLKAVLHVPETQAKDVSLGQQVTVDTHNGIVRGHVTRADAVVQNGTVTVEVKLDGPLPAGARADLAVDGTVEIERLTNVLYVARPAYGQPESVTGLFKLAPDGKTAERVNVKLGRASVNTIEIVQGLNPGDQVIVSDATQYDRFDHLRIK